MIEQASVLLPEVVMRRGAVRMLVVGACGTESLPSWLVRYYPGVPPGVTYAFRDDAVWTTPGRWRW